MRRWPILVNPDAERRAAAVRLDARRVSWLAGNALMPAILAEPSWVASRSPRYRGPPGGPGCSAHLPAVPGGQVDSRSGGRAVRCARPLTPSSVDRAETSGQRTRGHQHGQEGSRRGQGDTRRPQARRVRSRMPRSLQSAAPQAWRRVPATGLVPVRHQTGLPGAAPPAARPLAAAPARARQVPGHLRTEPRQAEPGPDPEQDRRTLPGSRRTPRGGVWRRGARGSPPTCRRRYHRATAHMSGSCCSPARSVAMP